MIDLKEYGNMPKPAIKSLMDQQMTRKQFLQWLGLFVVAIFGFEGVIRMLQSHAATPTVAVEPEKGSLLSGASVIADTNASGGAAVKFGQPGTTPAQPSSTNIYRPYSITDPKQLPHAPQDASYVNWNSLGVIYLDQAFAKLGANDILVLPERSSPYEADSSRGFMNDTTHYFEMARAKRGLVGLGPGVIVQPSASNFTGPQSTSTEGNLNKVIECATDGGYFANFEMRGRTFGGVAYDALSMTGNNAVAERVFCNGAHRGWRNYPPGETGGLTFYKGSSPAIYNCEVDCRDPATGTRVGASPFMFNVQSNVTVNDFYGHHSVAGMPTFWNVTNITTNRLRSEHNGSSSGQLSGSAINHELVGGTVTHNDSTMIIDYVSNGGTNTGLHISIGTNTTNAVYNFNRPTFDAGPAGAGTLSVAFATNDYPGFSQSSANIHATDSSGRVIPIKIYA